MKEYVTIRGYGSISVLGYDRETVFKTYKSGETSFRSMNENPVAALQDETSVLLEQLTRENKIFRGLDRSVLMAIYAARQAVADAGWTQEKDISINIGSSRGATDLTERYIEQFNREGTVPIFSSPVTTLGNISSWVAQDLNANGPVISHSVTCSTGVQAIANGFAWLKSGMADKFLAGASEAPLTPFTIAQMKVLGIYSDLNETSYPCQPLNSDRKNTFVLGEGAAVFALEMLSKDELLSGKPGLMIIDSVGFGFESIKSKTGVSKEGTNFAIAINNAIKASRNSQPIDLIITHAPGTVTGDHAELHAINSVFNKTEIPIISSSKWLTGHTLGASGCLSLEYALYILKSQSYLEFPYPVSTIANKGGKPINKILVTAAGFGGNAAALIVCNQNCI
ncbi:MAG: beta-ketoacyl synthase N-terminal-like domain-containing protein [Sphingobacteriaceae bacterium]